QAASWRAYRVGFRCFGLSFAFAAAPLVVSWWAARGQHPVHPALRGALIGLACGLTAGLAVNLWCPVIALRHILIGHVGPVAMMVTMGALVGGWLLPPRYR